MEKICKNCRFWDNVLADSENGICIRYPPVPLAWITGDSEDGIHSDVVHYWPQTEFDESCGEYKPKK